MSKHLVIAGAFEPEISPLRCLFSSRTDVSIDIVGIGLAKAKDGTQALVQKLQSAGKSDLRVIFIGSCGAVDSSIPLLSLRAASSVSLCQVNAPDNSCIYQPIKSSDELSGVLQQASDSTVPGKFYSSETITRSLEVAKQCRDLSGGEFENLELFSVAQVCNNMGIAWGCLSAVTNTVCPDGHEQWKANHERAAELTSKALLPVIPALLAS